ncbi:hypothetical protein FIBSPDRAFT_280087 [Athelia psychrophila]|uniref:Uncharacterized protein n=1 Tax=Athelia psychrophila TaxID=1759441 RepID=A0A165WGN4_9AGAM|nr:hypothetical protein FIBSPDRAFT_280087 [Fibularhizoctonia sp. CBS 109695]
MVTRSRICSPSLCLSLSQSPTFFVETRPHIPRTRSRPANKAGPSPPWSHSASDAPGPSGIAYSRCGYLGTLGSTLQMIPRPVRGGFYVTSNPPSKANIRDTTLQLPASDVSVDHP